jgi:periplasmic protein TonB
VKSEFVSAGILSLCLLTIPACSTPNTRTESAPKPISSKAPQYPPDMALSGISGEVVLSFVVDRNGHPKQITVVKSSAKEFETAALAAVAEWEFTPATRNGQAIESKVVFPIRFTVLDQQN